jgi:AraC-like DNA-binding protein
MELLEKPRHRPSLREVATGAPGVWAFSGASHSIEAARAEASTRPFKLLLQIQGRAEVRQGGRRVSLEPRQFALIDGADAFSVDASQFFEQVLIAMPRAAVLGRHRGIEHRTAVSHGRLEEEAVVGDLALSLGRHGSRLSEAALWRAIGSLVGLLGGLRDAGATAGDSLMQRALALIDLELADIDAQTLAARLGVSRRYLDKLFSRTGTSVSQFLWERRLGSAADQLQAAHSGSVAEVAYSVGFKDLSHFSRAFHKRFGAPPRAWRRGIAAGSAG